jgi:hypothetical protein
MVGDIFERGGKPDTIGRASCLNVYLFEDGGWTCRDPKSRVAVRTWPRLSLRIDFAGISPVRKQEALIRSARKVFLLTSPVQSACHAPITVGYEFTL